jgi:UDP-glucuronate 4-epimerase
MALFLFTKAILSGEPIKVFNNGNMVRDFTYVDDIIEGVTRVIDSPPSAKNVGEGLPSLKREMSNQREDGVVKPEATSQKQGTAPYKVYNIGNSSPVQLMEFIEAIEHHLGKTAKKELLPIQPGDVPRTEADVTDLVQDLDYKPDTSVKMGIGKFVKWYNSYIKH